MQTGRIEGTRQRGMLRRLAADKRGNTMLMMGAALFPIIGMAGSAFDMSRAYMVKTRLQQACDAGALAGRRAMTEADFDDDEAAIAEADKFFEFNFREDTFGATAIAFNATGTDEGQVTATANATVPMTLMQIFNVPEVNLNVDCDAILEIANNDIMFVLDVTGSMADTIAGGTKIQGLRDAVNAFYDVLDNETSVGARVRYGFVPFSSGINVGQVLLDSGNAGYLADSHTYQSRVANYTTAEHIPTDTPVSSFVERFQTSGVDRQISNTNCSNFGNNRGFNQSGFSFTGTHINNDNDIYDPDGPAGFQGNVPGAPTGYTRYQSSRNTNSWSNNPANRVCDRNIVITQRTYTTRYRFTNWSWAPTLIDTSQFKLGSSVPLVTNTGGTVAVSGQYNIQQLVQLATIPSTTSAGAITTSNYSWNRCIEERRTVDAADAGGSFNPIPDAAHDLQIDEIPSSEATRWKPIWQRLVYNNNNNSNASTQCPAAARRLSEMTAGEVSSFVNGLTPTGSTYLDFGMIWGARLISPTGIFAAANTTAPNGRQINRHVIFMTDGAMDPDSNLYTMYGIENRDRRISGTATTDEMTVLRPRHKLRFSAICRELRDNMNVTVWTIAFATAQEPEMLSCASPGHALVATSTPDLVAKFREIANRIAELRLAQ